MTAPGEPREQVPAALREAVKRDLSPVVPLAPPWRRAIAVAVPALVVLSGAVLVLVRGASAAPLLTFAGGGVSLLEGLAGLGLIWLALREAVPGLGPGAGRSMLALCGGVGLQLALGLVIWQRTRAGLSGPDAIAVGAQCAAIEGAIGLPLLSIATWLALRGLPIRPRWSGALAGAAAGMISDAVWHLACTRNDLLHLLVWHLGATVAMTILGALSGTFWPRRSWSLH